MVKLVITTGDTFGIDCSMLIEKEDVSLAMVIGISDYAQSRDITTSLQERWSGWEGLWGNYLLDENI